jgi:flavorubredoxin
MGEAFQARQISDRVHWVGAIDWGLRDFHGYRTSRGSTYNAYLVLGDPVTLIDTVKAPFVDEMLARVASVVDPARVRVIVSNHAEMDHAGGLPRVIEALRPERVIASALGVKALGQHFHWAQKLETAADGASIDLGGVTLRFHETRMLHWPDSMVTFFEEERVLFSQDIFGMHLAGHERFSDEIDPAVLREEAAKYFANILLPFAPVVTRMLPRLPAARVIAPDHGPIWRDGDRRAIEWYTAWAEQAPRPSAVVIFDSMWQSTTLMARAVGEGLAAGGVRVELLPLAGAHRSDIATAVLEAGAILVGSPTINGQIFPTLADALVYLKGLKPRNRVGAAFGSYGWSGEAVGHLEEMLREMKVEVVAESVRTVYVPDAETLARCRALGETVAARVRERVRAAP